MNKKFLSLLFACFMVLPLMSVYASDSDGGSYILLTFDDGAPAKSEDQSVAIMREFGYKGVLFVHVLAVQSLGTTTFRELKNEGWEIGSHSWSHPRCNELTMQELRHELIDSKVWLEQTFGVNVVSFAYPYGIGDFNSTVNKVLAEAGYLYARGDLWNSYAGCSFYGWSGEPSFQVNSFFPFQSNYQSEIQKIIEQSKTYGYAVASFHGVNSQSEGYGSLLPDQFRYCLQKIRDNGVTVITFQDLAGAEPKSEVEPNPPTNNLLANPSTENDRDGNGLPDGWSFYRTPNMHATCSWSSQSHTGSYSIKIASTYNSSATQKQSALWCQSVSNIVAGEIYKFRAWYHSNIQSTILLLAFSGSSTIKVAQLNLPASSSWVQSGWLSLTLPPRATSLRADARLFNIASGWVIFDDLELVSSAAPQREPPEPEPPAPETESMLDPSIEFGGGQPDCWSFYKTPNMIATESWVSDAHSGAKSVRIEATYNPDSKQTESALWYQDLAQFAVGETYRLRVWYKSNVQATILLLAFDNSRNLLRVTSLTLPASSLYSQSAWLSITVPEGTTMLRADARLFNKATGWALFDDFQLTQS